MRSVCGASPALYIVAREEVTKSRRSRVPSEKPPPAGPTSGSEEKAHLDALPDGALTETFPASDPVVRYTELAPDRFRDFWRD